MKKFIYSIVTLLILILINIISSKIFNLEFIELSFCVGLTSSVLVGFFSSEGGLIPDMTDISIKFLLDSKSRTSLHFIKFYINIINYNMYIVHISISYIKCSYIL